MSLALDRAFAGGRVPDWLRAFAADPPAALHDLLLGRAALGHLAVADPVLLLLDWLRGPGDRAGLTPLLDRTLADWIARHWGRPRLPLADQGAVLTTLAWVRVTDLLAAAPALTAAGDALTARVLADRRYLNGLATGRGSDPQAGAWRALAAHQRDRGLLPLWWGLCDIPPDQPWYRGLCGIDGLRGLPPEQAAQAGGFPKQVAEGSNRLGLALLRLAEQGWLRPQLAAEEFEDALRLLLGAYPFPDRWVGFWRHALRRDARRGDLGPWVVRVLPALAKPVQRRGGGRQPWADWDPTWPERARGIAQALRRREPDAIAAAESLLGEQRQYFDLGGDSGPLVRSATNFSRAIRAQRADLALDWARLARTVEPWDGYGWTNEAASLLALGRSAQALEVYRETVGRFPDDVVARNGLAEVLKAQDRLDEAEQVYRETGERFPDDVVARNGLAEVLKAQGRLDEAEQVYRETSERFSDDVVARNGLAEVLKAQGRLDEAEQIFRETGERFPDNVVARNGLAEVLKAQGRLDEAEQVYRETSERFPDDVVARNGLAEVLKAQGRLNEAEQVYRETSERFPDDVVARNGLAEVLKAQGRLDEAEQVYRETSERFPDNVVARNGLAEVLLLRGQPAAAEAGFRSALALEPSDEYALSGLARLGKGADPSADAAGSQVFDQPEPTSPDPSAPGIDRGAIAIIANDAFLVRGWARRVALFDPEAAQGRFRDRARSLLATLLPDAELDSVAAGASGLLELDNGELTEALALLRRAAERFPGSARVRYALARAEREAADGDALTPWRRLLRLDGHYQPIYYVGAGRALLGRLERGEAAAEQQGRELLGRLGHWVSERIEPHPDGADSSDARQRFRPRERYGFAGWWAREVQAELFDLRPVAGWDDLADLGPVRERARNRALQLDRLEEELVIRHASA